MTEPIWQALVLLLVAMAIIEGVVLVAVMRQVGGILLQLRPATVGELEGEGPLPGTPVEVPGLDSGTPAIVLFLSPNCALCEPLVPGIAVADHNYQDVEMMVAITGGRDEDRFAYAERVGSLAQPDLEQFESIWNIPGTPFAVGINKQSRVHSSGVVNSLDQIESLAESLLQAEKVTPSVEALATNGNGGSSKKVSLALIEEEE